VALSHCCCWNTVQCYREVLVDCFIMPITQEETIVKTGKFQVSARTIRLMKQLGLAAAYSSKPELQPLEKRDRRSLCDMSMEPAELMCK